MHLKTQTVKIISSMMILVFLLSGMTIYPDRATAQEDAPNYVIQGREEVNPYYTIEHLVFHDGALPHN